MFATLDFHLTLTLTVHSLTDREGNQERSPYQSCTGAYGHIPTGTKGTGGEVTDRKEEHQEDRGHESGERGQDNVQTKDQPYQNGHNDEQCVQGAVGAGKSDWLRQHSQILEDLSCAHIRMRQDRDSFTASQTLLLGRYGAVGS
ncbi:hypothetical protein [Streptomyces sp. NPDC059142]|uniref:hypothetical protein n=1 Tax=Streptomyces sp. NPDC059142 TaxID=3346739 RepID=UPI0036CB4AB3